MIRSLRNTLAFLAENFAFLLTFLSTVSTSASETRFFGKLLVIGIRGIPMGTNSAPLLADLFLHTFEYVISTICLSSTTTTLEILSVKFVRRSWNSRILPSILNRGVLLDTKIGHGDSSAPFHIGLYDKREDFNLRIVNSLSWTVTSLPIRRMVFTYLSWWDMLGFGSICTPKLDFIGRLRSLSSRLQQQLRALFLEWLMRVHFAHLVDAPT